MSDFKITISTMSLFPNAAAKCKGVSSPIFVVWTRAPRLISISTIFVWPPLAAQCNGENWWSSLKYWKYGIDIILGNLDNRTEFPLYFKACLPLVHIMFGIIKPHANLYRISFPNPMKNVFHDVGRSFSIEAEFQLVKSYFIDVSSELELNWIYYFHIAISPNNLARARYHQMILINKQID